MRMNPNVCECPVCGLSDVIHKWHVKFHDREFDYVICKSCGLIYLQPLPSHDAVLDAYREESPDYIYQEDYFSFLERCEEKTGPPIQLVKLIDSYLSKCSSDNIFALDVGAGVGSLLRVMRDEFGWQVEGIEPGPYSDRAARKHNISIYNVPIEEYDTMNQYDVITMMSVIEHTPKPAMMLRKVRSLLKRDGLLVLETPNADSWMARWKGARWGALLPPAHMLMFKPDTMEKLLRATGFLALRYFITGGYPFLGRYPFFADWIRRTQLNLDLSLPGGDSLIVFAQPT